MPGEIVRMQESRKIMFQLLFYRIQFFLSPVYQSDYYLFSEVKKEARFRVSRYFVVVQWLNCGRLFCDSTDCSPPSSSVRGISQARTLEWVCHFLLQGVVLSQGSNLVLLHWQVDSLPLSHMGRKPNNHYGRRENQKL